MDTNFFQVEQARIKSIIKERLVTAPTEAKAVFPDVLKRQRVPWASISEAEYLMVIFLNEEDERRINECITKKINPFLGLVTTGSQGAAFRIEKSRNMTIKSSSVTDSFALSLGPDSTIILEDFRQSINTKEFGRISYTVSLAYIISYGDEINKATIYDYFDGLVAYSISIWRGL